MLKKCILLYPSVIQGAVDLSKNSRLVSHLGSHYKKSEKIRAYFRHSGPLEYGADNARNGKGLRSRATDATPPIELRRDFASLLGRGDASKTSQTLRISQNLCPPIGSG